MGGLMKSITGAIGIVSGHAAEAVRVWNELK